ncbi:MAG: 2-phospho-L-lactate guanylyltransferase [Porticoccaceae bacterium]
MQVVIPVKSLTAAKARLSAILNSEERECLARYMLEDILAATGSAKEVTEVFIVSSDSQVDAIARTYGAQLIADTAGNLNGALQEAAAQLMAQGAQELLILHADVPLVTSAGIDRFIQQHRVQQHSKTSGNLRISLVAAEADGGTNALILSPPDALVPVFGEDSCRRFLESAKDSGINVQVVQNTEMALDIDRPDDLLSLLAISKSKTKTETKTQHYLEKINVFARFEKASGLPQQTTLLAGQVV